LPEDQTIDLQDPDHLVLVLNLILLHLHHHLLQKNEVHHMYQNQKLRSLLVSIQQPSSWVKILLVSHIPLALIELKYQKEAFHYYHNKLAKLLQIRSP
jgi:hypothetical protein